MKRPLSFFGFTVLSVLFFLNLFPSRTVVLCTLLSCAVLLILSLSFEKTRKKLYLPVIFLSALIAVSAFSLFENNYKRVLTFADNQSESEVVGTINENPYLSDSGRMYLVVKLRNINGKTVRGNLRLSFSKTRDGLPFDDLKIGNKVRFKGKLYTIAQSSSDVRNYYKSKNIYLGAVAPKEFMVYESKFPPFSYYVSLLKVKCVKILLRTFSLDEGGFLVSVLTGDKSYLKGETYALFKSAGVAHIMAVSGMHISIWITAVSKIFDDRKGKRKWHIFLMLFLLGFLMSFASFSGSVKRAGAMSAVLLFGKLLKRETDSLNSLGFAVGIILLFCPYGVFDIGLMLSFFSCLGICLVALPVLSKNKGLGEEKENLKAKIFYSIKASLVISLSVFLFTLPLTLYYFKSVSVVSPLSNLLLFFAFSPVLILTALFLIFSFVPGVSFVFALGAKIFTLYILNVVKIMGRFSFSSLNLKDGFWILWCAVCNLMLLYFIYKKKRIEDIALTLVISLGLGFLLSFTVGACFERKGFIVSYFPGDSYLVSCDGNGVLVGVSSEYYYKENLLETLDIEGVKIYAVIPFDGDDYYNISFLERKLQTRVVENNCEIKLSTSVLIKKNGNRVTVNSKDITSFDFGGKNELKFIK